MIQEEQITIPLYHQKRYHNKKKLIYLYRNYNKKIIMPHELYTNKIVQILTYKTFNLFVKSIHEKKNNEKYKTYPGLKIPSLDDISKLQRYTKFEIIMMIVHNIKQLKHVLCIYQQCCDIYIENKRLQSIKTDIIALWKSIDRQIDVVETFI